MQAQTLSVLYQALDNGLEIIPVLNKIDLPAANPDRVAKEIEHLLGISADNILQVSGKTGQNVDSVLDAIIERFPDPDTFKEMYPTKYTRKDIDTNGFGARALIFDSVYDPYK